MGVPDPAVGRPETEIRRNGSASAMSGALLRPNYDDQMNAGGSRARRAAAGIRPTSPLPGQPRPLLDEVLAVPGVRLG